MDERLDAFQQDVERRLGNVIKRAEQVLIAEKSRVLRPFELTVPQYAALMALSYADGMSAAQLARLSAVTPQTMSTILANLEGKGLLARQASPLHQKVQVVTLTEVGRDVVAQADREALAVEQELAAQFTAEEQAQLRTLLERVIAFLAARPQR